ncbi:uncharacterized protein LOC68175 [Mus musculus]|uniref:Uncharacterized protein n=1 Tax=Mus musculus TaxID=10090 RepID=Q9CQH6_MOUSE|nr:uncharacterized protein LOC68175 [Mus musculus]EDL07296.1 RIKEN cDNA 4930591A17 [Mus musculus]BAB31874.1 unnamed protein product [Mus musculus]BAB31875.1 unnamed protein product [Mus musculus]|eukprot:NP_080872.1 uncharacterized protein LOC68175 [Mus musculus]
MQMGDILSTHLNELPHPLGQPHWDTHRRLAKAQPRKASLTCSGELPACSFVLLMVTERTSEAASVPARLFPISEPQILQFFSLKSRVTHTAQGLLQRASLATRVPGKVRPLQACALSSCHWTHKPSH